MGFSFWGLRVTTVDVNTKYKELKKRALSPKEYAYVWSISIGKVRKDLASGALPHFRIGRRVCIPADYDPSQDHS